MVILEGLNLSAVLKTCSGCNQTKPENEFHRKRGKADTRCKVCKRLADKTRKEKLKTLRPVQKKNFEIIAPKSSTVSKPIMAVQLESTKDPTDLGDFSMWEEMYGHKLNDTEKLEIKTNLLGFYHCLKPGIDQLVAEGKIAGLSFDVEQRARARAKRREEYKQGVLELEKRDAEIVKEMEELIKAEGYYRPSENNPRWKRFLIKKDKFFKDSRNFYRSYFT